MKLGARMFFGIGVAVLLLAVVCPVGGAAEESRVKDGCANCHTDTDRMEELTAAAVQAEAEADSEVKPGYRVERVPFDRYERTLVSKEFLASAHGKLPCAGCHGGNAAAADPVAAHTGMVTRPSVADAGKVCGECHKDVVATAVLSTHLQPEGLQRTLSARCGERQWGFLKEKALAEQGCMSCHTGGCGGCHVSFPAVVGGGLREGHVFRKKTDFVYQCLSCHRSPMADDFGGRFSRGDMHYRDKGMVCVDCHGGKILHTAGGEPAKASAREGDASCLDCHKAVTASRDRHHAGHVEKVHCTVCHSEPYENCASCHMGQDKDGTPTVEAGEPVIAFKIGRNVQKASGEKVEWVLVRDVAVRPDSFVDYLKGRLASFEALPSYKRTVPHNIQRRTWQAAHCNHCHGRNELFLLEKDVPEGLRKANAGVIVPEASIPREVAGEKPLAGNAPEAGRGLRVSIDWVRENAGKPGIIIVDARVKEEYEEGHVPGAITLCSCHVRTKPKPGQPYFMKKPDELAALLGETLGLTPESTVVVYGDGKSPQAGMLFLALEAIGHSRVAFMDGHFKGWRARGMPVEKGPSPKVEAKIYPLRPASVLLSSADITGQAGKDAMVVIDARSTLEFMGHAKGKNVRTAGHIPGAVNLPLRALMKGDGRVLPPEELAWLFTQYGLDPAGKATIATSCNTGALAAELFMLLRSAGFAGVRVHDGAWLDWCAMQRQP